MSAEEWLEFLNSLTDEQLEALFTGLSVRILKKDGRIVRVNYHAI